MTDDLKLNISKITLNIKGLNTSIKIKINRIGFLIIQLYAIYKKLILNIIIY